MENEYVYKMGTYPGAIESWAVFDSTERYRYALRRRFAPGGKALHFCMLNPATADENKDDPTIRRCIVRASLLGYNAVWITNIFGWREGDFSKLKKVDNPSGGILNLSWNIEAQLQCEKTVVAWGTGGELYHQGRSVLRYIRGPLYCLGVTKGGYPTHPLYISYKTPLQEYDRSRHP